MGRRRLSTPIAITQYINGIYTHIVYEYSLTLRKDEEVVIDTEKMMAYIRKIKSEENII